jgi:hypothetical protein
VPLSRLELISSYGDQTLPRVRFVVHGTSNATDALSVLDAGLRFTEGRPTVSTNIIHAHDWTSNPAKQVQSWGGGQVVGEPGSVILSAIPDNNYLGYGIFTTAYIDRQLMRISGAPLRYAAGRKQLALYMSPETETARMHVEAEVANGYPLDQHPQYQIDRRYIIGSFPPGPGLDALLAQLDVEIRAMQPLDFDKFERLLKDVLRLAQPDGAVLAATAIKDIIVGTVESVLISRMRMMRWQGLQLLGFGFMEGKNAVEVTPVKDLAEQKRRMDDTGRLLASSQMFTAELAWLKPYLARQLDVMRLELDGADLQSFA